MRENTATSGIQVLPALEKCTQLTVIAVVVLLGGYLVWATQRGFEITDEAFYVLNGLRASDIRYFFSPTHWVVEPLWGVFDSLVSFRQAGLAILTAAAVIFAFGGLHVAACNGWSAPIHGMRKLAVVATTVAAAWLYGSTLNFAPSYNLLCAAGAYFCLGIFFLSLGPTGAGRSGLGTAGLSGVLGIGLGLTVISKFSGGICITLVVLALHVASRPNIDRVAARIVIVLTVLVGTVVATILVQSSFALAWEQFRSGLIITTLNQGGEGVTARLLRNLDECAQLLQFVVKYHGGPLLAAAVAGMLRRSLVTIVALAWFGWTLASSDALTGGMGQYAVQMVPLTAILCMALVLGWRDLLTSWRTAMMALVLVALPFLVAIGSSNVLSFQIVLSLSSWGLICGLLAARVTSHGGRLAGVLLCLAFVSIVASQVVTSGLRAPYRLAEPLSAQSISTNLGVLGQVKVDRETVALVDDVNAAARNCQMAPGMPFLGFYNLPGIALLLNAIPVDTPWLYSDYFAQAALDRMPPYIAKKAIVALMLNTNGERPVVPLQLAGLTDDHRLCGSAMLPFLGVRIEIWAPRGNPIEK